MLKFNVLLFSLCCFVWFVLLVSILKEMMLLHEDLKKHVVHYLSKPTIKKLIYDSIYG
jgi:hypothetical protein